MWAFLEAVGGFLAGAALVSIVFFGLVALLA